MSGGKGGGPLSLFSSLLGPSGRPERPLKSVGRGYSAKELKIGYFYSWRIPSHLGSAYPRSNTVVIDGRMGKGGEPWPVRPVQHPPPAIRWKQNGIST